MTRPNVRNLAARDPGPALLVAGVAVAVVGTFLPWGASGRAERSSYELVAVLSRLEVVDGWRADLATAWYFLPLLAAAALVAVLAGRRPLARILGTAMGVAVVGMAVAVTRSPLSPRPGMCVTIIGTVLLGGGVLWRRPHPPASKKERAP
ncbi:MAG: hypothetical protein WKF93_10435 [Acidimicrobiales bacterium]